MVGTAGHIDHGKTSLVRALTGHDTDRHPEERRRGITIELGFAPWPLAPDLDLSIVDVPGHESFVRTMIAGAGGLDLVVLVVSAEDGVMPQTREHLNICRLLGVRDGVVALTKVDLLDDPEAVELATEDVRETLARSVFERAPIFACSATTGAGLEALQSEIAKRLRQLPARPKKARVRLPVDRVFTMKGHGTVVTGTLLSGELALSDETSLAVVGQGSAKAPTPRLRGLQVRGEAVYKVRAGSRVAANLGGVGTDELSRGDVLCTEDAAIQSEVIHVLVDVLEAADGPLRTGVGVQLCAGAAHTSASVDPLALVLDEGPNTAGDDLAVAPGQRALLRLRLETALPVWWGQRVVLRAFNSSRAKQHGLTIAGGRVVDPHPSRGRAQRPRWVAVAQALRGDDERARAWALIADAGVATISGAELRARAGLEQPGKALGPLLAAAPDEGSALGSALELANDRYVDRSLLEALTREALARLETFHNANPVAPGLSRGAVEQALPARVHPALARTVLDRAIDSGQLRIVDTHGTVALPGRGQLDPEQLPADLASIVDLYARGGTSPPTLKDLAAAEGRDVKDILESVSLLQRHALLVRVTNDLSYHPHAHERLVDEIKSHLAQRGEIDVQALKALSGLSRKFAVPFLEHLDRLGITKRVGDKRVPGPKA